MYLIARSVKTVSRTKKKLHQLHDIINLSNRDIITETWLNDKVNDRELLPSSSYTVFRRDRQDVRGDVIVVWGEGYHCRCPMFDKSMDATNASGHDLDRGVLPGQQAVVRCRNSVKVEDFLNSFFIHSIFVQTLSDMCVLLSPVRQGAAIQPRG